MTIVGRERTSLSVDVVVISAWLVLGLVVAHVVQGASEGCIWIFVAEPGLKFVKI